MNLNDLSTIYTEAHYKEQDLLKQKSQKFFRKKILPKILKAVKEGDASIEVLVFRKKTDLALSYYLQNFNPNEFKFLWDREYENDSFVRCTYTIRGWKLLQLDPDSILKKNL